VLDMDEHQGVLTARSQEALAVIDLADECVLDVGLLGRGHQDVRDLPLRDVLALLSHERGVCNSLADVDVAAEGKVLLLS